MTVKPIDVAPMTAGAYRDSGADVVAWAASQ